MGSNSKGQSTSTTTTGPPPQVMSDYYSVMNRANQVASTPYQPYTGNLVQGFSPDQLTAFQNVNNAQNAWQPFINQAQTYATLGASPIQASAIANYSNPYQQQVINATLGNIDETNRQQQARLLGSNLGAGGLFNDRMGVAQGELAREQGLANNATLAGLNAGNYSQALTAAQADRAAAGQAAYTFGNLGNESLQNILAGSQAQLGTGAMQQQLGQAQLNVPYMQWQQAQAFPYQQTGWLAGIDTGVGSNLGGTSTTVGVPPQPNQFAQYAGLGIAGLGAAGNLGWMPFAAGGGRIHGYADGGAPEGISIPFGAAVPGMGQGMSAVPYGGAITYVPGGSQITRGSGPPRGGAPSGGGTGAATDPYAADIKALGNLGSHFKKPAGDIHTGGDTMGLTPEEWDVARQPSLTLGDSTSYGTDLGSTAYLGAAAPDEGFYARGGPIVGDPRGIYLPRGYAEGGAPDEDTAPPPQDTVGWGDIDPEAFSPRNLGMSSPSSGNGSWSGFAPGPADTGAPVQNAPARLESAETAPQATPADLGTAQPAGVSPTEGAASLGQPAPPPAGPAGLPLPFVSAIKRSEGFEPRAKWDYHQYTNGYGTRARYPGEVIDEPTARRRFDAEIGAAANIVDRVNPNLDPGTRAALTSLTFNAGDSWVNGRLGEQIRNGDIAGARKTFQQYNKAGGSQLSGLVERRAEEASWFGKENIAPSRDLMAFADEGRFPSRTRTLGDGVMSFAGEEGEGSELPAMARPAEYQGQRRVGGWGSPEMNNALMAAGFAMMANRSPWLGQAVGNAGLAGLGTYTQGVQHQEALARQGAKEAREEKKTDLAQSKVDAYLKNLEQHRAQSEQAVKLAAQREERAAKAAAVTEANKGLLPGYSWADEARTKQVFTPGGPHDPEVIARQEQAKKTAGSSSLDAPSIDGAAEVYLKTGMFPPGMNRAADKPDRDAIRARAYEFVAERNIDPTDLPKRWQQFKTEQTGITRFTSGPQGNSVRSIGVAVEHLQTLRELGAALRNGNIQIFNELSQRWARATGSPAPTNFDTAKQIIGTEIIKAIGVAGAGTKDEREGIAAQFARASSPDQIEGVVKDAVRPLLLGQLHGLQHQFSVSTGLPAERFNDLLQPGAREWLTGGTSTPPSAKPAEAKTPARPQISEGRRNEVLKWLAANPNNPSAPAIRQRLEQLRAP